MDRRTMANLYTPQLSSRILTVCGILGINVIQEKEGLMVGSSYISLKLPSLKSKIIFFYFRNQLLEIMSQYLAFFMHKLLLKIRNLTLIVCWVI